MWHPFPCDKNSGCLYCHVPAGLGLQRTTLAPGNDKTRGQGSFGPLTGAPSDNYPKFKKKRPDRTLDPFY